MKYDKEILQSILKIFPQIKTGFCQNCFESVEGWGKYCKSCERNDKIEKIIKNDDSE